jgi:hypothetical protein
MSRGMKSVKATFISAAATLIHNRLSFLVGTGAALTPSMFLLPAAVFSEN